MATDVNNPVTEAVMEDSRATRDAISVRRVFGEAYEVEGQTIIPVASVSGGGGGGGGEGTAEAETDDDQKSGSGYGSGFGLTARPVGAYVVDENGVEWKPAVDVSRLAKGGQVLVGIVAVCLTIILWRREG
ncbi:MAG: spore germination protein GerW family protein [Acidimicrobiales bacterium]